MTAQLTQITQTGGNLYQVAAQYLGDATQWTRIAWANGLTDPMLTGLTTLRLPPIDPSQTGGYPVGSQ